MDSDIYKAAMEGRIETFANRPDLDRLVTTNNNTILHVYLTTTTREASIEFVKQIVELSPTLLIKPNYKGEIPLHLAVKRGLQDVVRVLIDESNKDHQFAELESAIGATKKMLTMRNNDQETALHMAARQDNVEVVELLTRGDPGFENPANNHGETPIYIAARRKNLAFVTKILGTCRSLHDYNGPKGTTALHAPMLSYRLGTSDVIRKIIAKEPRLMKVADNNGWIPLHYAAYFGFKSIVEFLLGHDRSLAYIAVEGSKMTALHLATLRGNITSMREIIERCPDSCDLVDKRGWSVFHYAIVSFSWIDEESWRFRIEGDPLLFLLKHPFLQHLIREPDVKGVMPYHLYLCYRPFHRFWCVYFQLNQPLEKTIEMKEGFDIGVGPGGHIRIKKPQSDADVREFFQRSRGSRLVVAALIATVTFAAAFTLPGGTDKGVATLRKSPSFQAFLISDALSMVLSTVSVVIQYATAGYSEIRRSQLWVFGVEEYIAAIAISAMIVAFVTGVYAVLPPSSGLSIAVCFVGLSCFLGLAIMLICSFISRRRSLSVLRRLIFD